MTMSQDALAITTSVQPEALAELSSIPYPATLLDRKGCIAATNPALQLLVEQGQASDLMHGALGTSFPLLCARVLAASGGKAAAGIHELLAGTTGGYELVYRWHSPVNLRWFRLQARRPSSGAGVLLTHIDVTDLHMAHARLSIQMSVSKAINSRVDMLSACRQLALHICEELAFDYAGIWTIDRDSWTLRCVDTWLRDDLALEDFERASRTAALAPGVGLAGRAWQTAEVQWATDLDLAGVPSFALAPEQNGPTAPRVMPPASLAAGFRSALAFPLKCGEDVLAVVDLFSRVRRSPDPALTDVLDVAGDQLALWELRERAERCAEASQRETNEMRSQLEAVLECAPAFVVVLDAGGIVRFINRTVLQSKAQVIGCHWTSFVAHSDQPQVQRAFEEVLRTGALQTYQLSMPGPNGTTLWYTNYMGPMRSGSAITGVVITSQDVTATRRAQAELMDAQRMAAVGTLAAGIAHEINTPVQFVSDSVHFLRDAVGEVLTVLDELRGLRRLAEQEPISEELRSAVTYARAAEERADLNYLLEHMPKAFERSIDGLTRVTAIVRSMKEFAHPAQKQMAEVDLNRALRSTLTVARSEYKDVAELELALTELPPVTCHVNEINQVLLNIVVNAAHAIADVVGNSARKGLITVSTKRDGEFVVLSVTDTGDGIPPHVAARVFEPFFTTKAVGRGTGQGLAMAWHVIRERHGGELSFETEAHKGTTFLVRLPIAGKLPARESA
jgi:PAS domain S-box-containing protein